MVGIQIDLCAPTCVGYWVQSIIELSLLVIIIYGLTRKIKSPNAN